MKNLIHPILFLFFLIQTQFSFAQIEDFTPTINNSATGATINFENKTHSFTLNVSGKKINPLPNNGKQNYLSIDGFVLQYLTVPFQEKIDYAKLSLGKKKDFLLDYERYEMDYIKSNLKVKNLEVKFKYLTLNGNIFLLWFYDMPKKSMANVKQQCYLITVCFDNMFVLNSPVSDNIEDTMDFLVKTGNTLKIIR